MEPALDHALELLRQAPTAHLIATVLSPAGSSLIRLEHTLFALPYAYVGAIFAVDGWPSVAPTSSGSPSRWRRPLGWRWR